MSSLAFMPDNIARGSVEAQVDWVRAFYAQMYTALLAHMMPMPDMPSHFNVDSTEGAVQLARIMASFLSQCAGVIGDMEQATEDCPYTAPEKDSIRAFAFPPVLAEKSRYFDKSSTRYNIPGATRQRMAVRSVHIDRDRVRAGAAFASLAHSPDGLGLTSSGRSHYHMATYMDFQKDVGVSP